MKTRYKVSHGERILDTDMMEYLSLEEICAKLNAHEHFMDFLEYMGRELGKEDNKHE